MVRRQEHPGRFPVLYYTILYTILYYTILYYTILYYTILYYTRLYYTMLYYVVVYHTIRAVFAGSDAQALAKRRWGCRRLYRPCMYHSTSIICVYGGVDI